MSSEQALEHIKSASMGSEFASTDVSDNRGSCVPNVTIQVHFLTEKVFIDYLFYRMSMTLILTVNRLLHRFADDFLMFHFNVGAIDQSASNSFSNFSRATPLLFLACYILIGVSLSQVSVVMVMVNSSFCFNVFQNACIVIVKKLYEEGYICLWLRELSYVTLVVRGFSVSGSYVEQFWLVFLYFLEFFKVNLSSRSLRLSCFFFNSSGVIIRYILKVNLVSNCIIMSFTPCNSDDRFIGPVSRLCMCFIMV